MKKITLSFLMILSVVMYSCKDDSGDPNPKTTTPTHPLNGTTWLITGATIDPPIDFFGVEISDLYAIMDDCSKDDETTFNADSTYVTMEGATKCDPSDPQEVGTGNWSLSSDKKTLVWDDEEFTVTTLNTTTMVLTETYFDEDTQETYTTTITLTKKK